MLHILEAYLISLRKKISIFFSNSQTSQIWSKNPTVPPPKKKKKKTHQSSVKPFSIFCCWNLDWHINQSIYKITIMKCLTLKARFNVHDIYLLIEIFPKMKHFWKFRADHKWGRDIFQPSHTGSVWRSSFISAASTSPFIKMILTALERLGKGKKVIKESL